MKKISPVLLVALLLALIAVPAVVHAAPIGQAAEPPAGFDFGMFKVVFDNVSVAGIPLLAFVLGLVQWIKGFGLTGKTVKLLSMGVGVFLGVGYQFSTVPPVDFSTWFAAIIFGVALGLVASGLYDAQTSK